MQTSFSNLLQPNYNKYIYELNNMKINELNNFSTTNYESSSSPRIQEITNNQDNVLPPLYNYNGNNSVSSLPSIMQVFGDILEERLPSYYGIVNYQNEKQTTENVEIRRRHSFITLVGEKVQKRVRRRFHEIPRYYDCLHPGCNRAYGALNHLNAHIIKENHGRKRKAKEFKHLLNSIKENQS